MDIINWLLEGEPYVQYAVRKNILRQNTHELSDLKSSVLKDVRIQEYLSDIADFNATLVTNHKNSNLPIHKLLFLLELGLDTDVPQIDMAIQQILQNKDENGIPKSMTNVPKHFGGSGEDTLAWALCDAPLMLYALIKSGIDYEHHVKEGAEHILGLYRVNGFPCAVSNELGKFRGPGRKDDCCPYATLIILKLLSIIPEYQKSELANAMINILLGLWESSQDQHPYMFFMGRDFRELKAPALWYDIVSVAECLSYFESARKDQRFHEMLDIIGNKANARKQFIPESVYLKCSEWDFGQKKQPSKWLTYICIRLLERSGR
ncbi:MAG: hypothetical protein WCF96_02885 [Eubacteriales bacterium]